MLQRKAIVLTYFLPHFISSFQSLKEVQHARIPLLTLEMEKFTALTLEIMQNEYIFKMEMGKHMSEKVLAHYLILLFCC